VCGAVGGARGVLGGVRAQCQRQQGQQGQQRCEGQDRRGMRAGWMNLRCGRGSVLGGGRASWPSVAGNAANVTVGRAGLLLVRVDSSILSVGVCGKVEQTQTQTPTPTGREKQTQTKTHTHTQRGRRGYLTSLDAARPRQQQQQQTPTQYHAKPVWQSGQARWTRPTRVRRRNRR
jgi:hypothetical protein